MLSYQQRGAGRDVRLLLHGFLGSGRNLLSLARRWCERNGELRLILPDLTGHGSSPPLQAAPTLNQVAEEILRLADALALPSPVPLVGHSFGGRVALAARLLAPERVGEVVLLDITPGPLAHTPQLDRLLEALLDLPEEAESRGEMAAKATERIALPGPLLDWLLLNLQRGEDGRVAWRIDRQRLATLHHTSRNTDLWPAVELAPSATRCIRGGTSSLVSEADVERFRRVGSRVDTLAGAGHFVHLDALPELIELLQPVATA